MVRRVGLFGIGVALLVAPAAGAAEVHVYTGTNSATGATQVATIAQCAAGERALGGGVVSNSQYDYSELNAILPQDGPDADNARNDQWGAYIDVHPGKSINTTAAIACVGGSAGKNLKYRSKELTIHPAQLQKGVAKCPKGYKVTGGGVSNGAGYGHVGVTASRPIAHKTRWEGELNDYDLGMGSSYSMTVYAICAKGRFAKKLDYFDADLDVPHGGHASQGFGCSSGLAVGGGVRAEQAPGTSRSLVVTGTGIDGVLGGSVSVADNVSGVDLPVTDYLICYR